MQKKKSVVLLLAVGAVLIFCWYGGRDNISQTSTPRAPSYIPSLPPDVEGVSLQEAEQQVSFTIVNPEYLPSGFHFVEAYVLHGKVALVYEDRNNRRITISQWEEEQYAHHPYPGEEEITFNGTTAYFSVPDPYNLLWQCNNVIISLSADLSGGKEVVKAEMIRIAQSMKCGVTMCDTLTCVWEFNFEEIGNIHPFFTLADEKIYAHHRTTSLYCLSAKKGNLLWNISMDEPVYSPIIASLSKIYFTTEKESTSSLFCIDGETGTVEWEKKLGYPSPWYFTVSDSNLYIYDCSLCCYHAVTGELLWKNEDISNTYGPIAVEGDRVVVGSLQSGNSENQQFTIYCLDGIQGNIIWSRRHGTTPGKLLIENGRIYNLNVYGVQCIDLSESDILWEVDLGKITSAGATEEKIYVTIWGSTVACLDAEIGETLWTYTIVGKDVPITHPVDWVAVSLSPQIEDNRLYTGSQKKNPYIYCFDAETGNVIWKYEKGGCWYSAPFVRNGNLYYAVCSGVKCYQLCNRRRYNFASL